MPPLAGCRVVLGREPPHLGDVVLQEVFVQRVSDLQPTDKRERRYLFAAIGDHDELSLEEIDVGFEAIS